MSVLYHLYGWNPVELCDYERTLPGIIHVGSWKTDINAFHHLWWSALPLPQDRIPDPNGPLKLFPVHSELVDDYLSRRTRIPYIRKEDIPFGFLIKTPMPVVRAFPETVKFLLSSV